MTPIISPLPPRYSSLTGTLSPESSQMLRSLSTTSGQPGGNGAYPPRYSNVGVNAEPSSSQRQHSHNSPSGSVSRSAGLQPFECHIKSGNKTQPWATLKVFSRSSSSLGSNSSSVKLPKFTSKDPVQGCLELNLESPQNINSISLSVRLPPFFPFTTRVEILLVEGKDRKSIRTRVLFPRPPGRQLDPHKR